MSFSLMSFTGFSGWLESTAYGGPVENKPLKLLVVNRAGTYQKLAQIEKGFEFELLQQFALDMGYRLQVQVVRSPEDIQKKLAQGYGDMGAARFSDVTVLDDGALQSPIYDEDKTTLVCRRNSPIQVSEIGQLGPDNKFTLLINPQSFESKFVPLLKQSLPGIKIRSRLNSSAAFFLHSLREEKADCTLMDKFEAQYHLRIFPDLAIIKDISNYHSHFFLISKSRPELADQMRRWIAKAAHQKVISKTKSKSRGSIEPLTIYDLRRFLSDQNHILPIYLDFFKKYSQQYGIPWQLSAAIAYQESKWDPFAESFTGVKGIMQLTQETAEYMEIDDRVDPEQSIAGGVRYIRLLIDRQPKGLPYKEKLALALATYNVGPAHMIDAQALAKKLRKNPYLWKDMKEVLPLLASEEYLPELKYGPARGQEPVDFVTRVFAFLDLMI